MEKIQKGLTLLNAPAVRSLLLLCGMYFGFRLYQAGMKELGAGMIGGGWSAFLALLAPDKTE